MQTAWIYGSILPRVNNSGWVWICGNVFCANTVTYLNGQPLKQKLNEQIIHHVIRHSWALSKNISQIGSSSLFHMYISAHWYTFLEFWGLAGCLCIVKSAGNEQRYHINIFRGTSWTQRGPWTTLKTINSKLTTEYSKEKKCLLLLGAERNNNTSICVVRQYDIRTAQYISLLWYLKKVFWRLRAAEVIFTFVS